MRGIDRHTRVRTGFTFVELILALVVAVALLACFWLLVTTLYGQAGGTSAKARQALELTEFCELVLNDLYHARYITYDGADSAATLGIVGRKLNRDGEPEKLLVRYRVDSGGKRITREQESAPRRTTTVEQPEDSKRPIRLSLDRETGRITFTLADEDLQVPVDEEIVAPSGSTLEDAPADPGAVPPGPGVAQVDVPVSETGAPPGPEDAEATAAGRDFREPQPGQPVPGSDVASPDEMSYQFLAGGDEEPYDGEGGEASPGFERFTSSSNLDYERRRGRLVFGQRRGESPAGEWRTAALPNPVAEGAGGSGVQIVTIGTPGGGPEIRPEEIASLPRGETPPATNGPIPDITALVPQGGDEQDEPPPADGTPRPIKATMADVDSALKAFFRSPSEKKGIKAGLVIKDFIDSGSPGLPPDGTLPPEIAEQYPHFAKAYKQSRGMGGSWGRPGYTKLGEP